MIDELSDGIRALELWPFETAKAGNESSGKADAGQPSRERSAHAGVDAISGGWCVQVSGKRRLIKTVITEAGFVHPLRVGSENPISSANLSAGVNLGTPLWLQFGKIFDRPIVIAVKVKAANVIALIWVVVHLTDHIVNADIVWKSLHYINALGVIRWKACTGASDRCRSSGPFDSAARNHQTGGTDRNAIRQQVINCVRNAAATVAIDERRSTIPGPRQ